jgi:hypothetical protein
MGDVIFTRRFSSETEIFYFNEGNEFTNITGGWEQYDTQISGSFTKTTNALRLTIPKTSTNSEATAGTANKINVTNINKIVFDVNVSNRGRFEIALHNTKSRLFLTTTQVVKATFEQASAFTVSNGELDVSNFSGEYYIVIAARGRGAYTTLFNIDFTRIEGIK